MENSIDKFWTAIAKISNGDNNTIREETINLITELLVSVHPKLSHRLKVAIFGFDNFALHGPEGFSEYAKEKTKNMKIVSLEFQIGVGGDVNLVPILDQFVAAAKAYPISEHWRIVKYFTAHDFERMPTQIHLSNGETLNLSDMRYRLTKLSDIESEDSTKTELLRSRELIDPYSTMNELYDVVVIIENDPVYIKNNQDIEQLRRDMFDWFCSLIGEYRMMMFLPCMTVVPEKIASIMKIEAGYYCTTMPEQILRLKSIRPHAICCLCELTSINTTVETVTPTDEYPYIRGDLCEHCVKVLKHFRKTYALLRAEYATSKH
jgi:hypothetical protein